MPAVNLDKFSVSLIWVPTYKEPPGNVEYEKIVVSVALSAKELRFWGIGRIMAEPVRAHRSISLLREYVESILVVEYVCIDSLKCVSAFESLLLI